MKAVLAIVAVALAGAALAGCPRSGGVPDSDPEPQAEPAPVEIDWPDAAVPPDPD